MKLIRTERGWKGHFICSSYCEFGRNTLLEYGKIRIVISTVGMMRNYHCPDCFNIHRYETIGCGRYYETMAFHAKYDNPYWDADVSKQVDFDGEWFIEKKYKDQEANDMHEAVVTEISKKMLKGKIT